MDIFNTVSWTNIIVASIILVSIIVCLIIYNNKIQILPFYIKTMLFFIALILLAYIFSIVSFYGIIICKICIACLITNVLFYFYISITKTTKIDFFAMICFIAIFTSMILQIFDLFYYRNISIGVLLLNIGIKVSTLIFRNHNYNINDKNSRDE